MDLFLEGGFADPVLDAQSTFRAVLDALARPGGPQALPMIGTGGPLPAGLSAVLLTLVDHDTPIWLSPSLRQDAIIDFVRFHTGARVATHAGDAAFAFAAAEAELPPLAEFAPGTQDYPDRSCTIVLAVPSLAGGPPLTARGPGIRDHVLLAPLGLPADFLSQWQENAALFPRGVDLLLIADGQVMGLPRTTRIEERR